MIECFVGERDRQPAGFQRRAAVQNGRLARVANVVGRAGHPRAFGGDTGKRKLHAGSPLRGVRP